MTARSDAADLVRTDLYPLDALEGPRMTEVIARARADLDSRQFCVLEDFVTEDARAAMAAESLSLLPEAYENRSHRTCFLNQKHSPDRPEDHPMNKFFDARFRILAYDLFADDGPITSLYAWEPVRRMIAAITGSDALYLNEDPYQPTVVMCAGDGDVSPWHFDRGNAFTVTLMLQEPDEGGVFEIAPEIWPDDDADPSELLDVIEERAHERVIAVERVPASMVIFRGNRSVHRVTEVKGDRLRLMAVMSYEDRPGVVGRPEVNASVFGPRVLSAQV